MKRTVLLLLLGICTTSIIFTYEYDEVKELLAAEKQTDGYNEITYLSRINSGICGGENWIAVRKSRGGVSCLIYVYVIDSEKKVRTVDAISVWELEQAKSKFRGVETLEFDPMRNIPGTQIGDLVAKFADYNGDSLDEIIYFSLAIDDNCLINAWDGTGKGTFIFSNRITVKSPHGPPPVEFTNYRGVDGIKVYLKDTMNVEDIWEFWAWDEGSKKYVELANSENEEIDYSQFTPVTQEADNESDIEEAPPVIQEDNGKKTRFAPKTIIISGVIALAVIMCVIIVIRKKKSA